MPDITKILIANRGEIACRVIRTARRMGIPTVAVYSDADRDALHVRMADEAVHIGPAPAAQSYLVIDKIVDAAKQTGADAVHPGYGFLSENPDFVRALDKAGITFIGPSAEAIEAMGLKDRAKDLMADAGVPITPGYQGEDQADDVLAKAAEETGFPVLIKAVAGGGGKGMRKVESADQFAEMLASARREAKAAFGNDRVLIEKFITSPRHIEVQVFGDTHGNVVHMFERDCSLQRRHQKVIEEAPAPGMTEEVREAMTSAAVKAAQAVDYVGAGTVEFIVDGSGELRTDGFYFMEMNTRLQVEHPVTEEITGLDLVEWQIRVARGEALPEQGKIAMSGHAIEARIYAEDPANNFLPSVGRIKDLDLPRHHDRGIVREEIGVTHGDEITIYYDPMIAKLIYKGHDRKAAIRGISRALSWTDIAGLKTNIAFLSELVLRPEFIAATHTTSFIDQQIDDLVPHDLGDHPAALALAATAVATRKIRDTLYVEDAYSPWDVKSSWRNNLPPSSTVLLERDAEKVAVTVSPRLDKSWTADVGGEVFHVKSGGGPRGASIEEGLCYLGNWSIDVHDDRVCLRGHKTWITGSTRIDVRRPQVTGADQTSPNALTAPMPGTVISVSAAPGDAVTEGQTLLVLEAMKMEMAIKAPRDGVVAEVSTEAGARVSDGDVLVNLEGD